MQFKKEHACGGVLYTNRTIITAAHCCKEFGRNQVEIVAGVTHFDIQSDHEQRRLATGYLMHPG